MRELAKGGQLKILEKEEVERIHYAVLEVLENVGVKVESEEARKILVNAGCEIEKKKGIVWIPGYLVEESIRKAPKRIRLCGQTKENDIILEGRKVCFGPTCGPTSIIDLDTGEKRDATFRDCEDSCRFADALSNIDFVMPIVSPTDVPSEVLGLYEELATLTGTKKHGLLFAYHEKRLIERQIEMASLVAGGEKELKKRPFLTLYGEPRSPLTLGKNATEAVIVWGRRGLPVIYAPCIIAGATAPITLAGAVVQGVAESLAGNVLVQLENPGTPFIFGAVPQVIDMRYALTTYGSPEAMLMDVAQAQLSDYYQIPLFGTGGVTDSKYPDGQQGIEAGMGILISALAGQNLIHDIGYLESALAGSFDSLLICDEIISYTKRVLKGIEVNRQTLAPDTISDAFESGNFLQLKHTREFFQKEHILPELIDRSSRKVWEAKGRKELRGRAREKAKKIFGEHRVEFPKDVRRELERIINESKGTKKRS
jgi:trimethylamine--corrinoid protein Co-methyltransferase